MGQAPPGSDCNKQGLGTPFVKVGEFGQRRPDIREWTTRPLKMAKTGDVLLCVVGATVGKINEGIDCAIGRSVAALRPRPTLDSQYLLNFMFYKMQEIRSGSRGSAQGVISKSDLKERTLPIPPVVEQQRIAEILEEQFSRLDAALASIRSAQKKAAAFRRSLLHSILQGADEDSLPDGWVRTTLGEVTRVSAGRTPNRFESRLAASVRPNRVVPFYKVGDMNDAPQFMNTARVHFAEDEAGEFGIAILPSGSVVFPKAGGAIATNKKRIIQTPGAVDLNCMAVTASEAVDERFIYWFFESFDLTSLSDGSILPQIGKKKVTATSIAFPKSRVEQSAVVTAIETEMTRLQSALRVTDQLEARIASERRSLLHAAFSGTLTAQWRETHHG